ncbi:MAG: GTPase HflX [Dehalococcoidia bacterium]
MAKTYTTGPFYERAILVGINLRNHDNNWSISDSLSELSQLAFAAQTNPIIRLTQSLNTPSQTYVGKGKLNELKSLINENKIQVAIFDDELNPNQQRMLEDYLKIKVIDRTALIIDVFAQRASTKEGRLQIELAQTEYLLPRLAGQWSHLERLGGGVGTRGPGETQIETDRRLVRKKINRIKNDITKIQKQRENQRNNRSNTLVHNVSLVGYTNAGKSALFNNLTTSKVIEKNQLFSTLDTTSRKLYINSNLNCIISDTVGFVNKLPPILVAAFKTTLEESISAELLLHITDVSSPYLIEQIKIVNNQLSDLDIGNKPKILVLNKKDLLVKNEIDSIDNNIYKKINETGIIYEDIIVTSAKKNWGIKEIKSTIKHFFT